MNICVHLYVYIYISYTYIYTYTIMYMYLQSHTYPSTHIELAQVTTNTCIHSCAYMRIATYTDMCTYTYT